MSKPLVLGLLLAVSAVRGEVSLVDGRLTIDGLARVKCRWQQSLYMGLTDSRFDFYRPEMLLGVTGRIVPVASVRVCCDVAELGNEFARDMYVHFGWPSGWNCRVGQFVPPLSYEALEDPGDLKVIGYSFLVRYWKPWNQRDVGVQAGYESRGVSLSAAVVNGYGIGQGYEDSNKWKDGCIRLAYSPSFLRGLHVAGRSYYGRIDEAVDFWNAAAEVVFDRAPVFVLAECQLADKGTQGRTSMQVVTAYRLTGLLEPAARVQVELQSEDRYDFGFTGGLNLHMLNDRVRSMLDFEFRRRQSAFPELRVTEQRIILQLQGVL